MDLNEHVDDDMEEEFLNYTARKVLLELFKICEKHDINKQGLMEEFREGLDEDKFLTDNLEANNEEIIGLELEKIARVGDKRKELQCQMGSLQEEQKEYPRKIIEHELSILSPAVDL